jgi:hypothetical protein
MDAVQRLTWDAEQVVAVLGNIPTGEFVLADLGRDGAPLSDAEMGLAKLKGLSSLARSDVLKMAGLTRRRSLE